MRRTTLVGAALLAAVLGSALGCADAKPSAAAVAKDEALRQEAAKHRQMRENERLNKQ